MMLTFKDRKVKQGRTGTKNARVQDHISQKTKDEGQKAQGIKIVPETTCKFIYQFWKSIEVGEHWERSN